MTSRVEIVAHRGGALLWPENSLRAFRGAIALGVDAIECDVHLSRDGEVVVLHDATLDRTTSGRGPVAGHAWADLAPLTVAGAPGEPIPRLADVLALAASRPVAVQVEVKAGVGGEAYAGIEARIVRLCAAHGLLDRTSLLAFDWAVLERIPAPARPACGTGLLGTREALRLGGVVPAVARLAALGAGALGIEGALLTPDAVAAARAAGLRLGVWTPSEDAELRRAIALGVDFVTTDRPDLALRLRGETASPEAP